MKDNNKVHINSIETEWQAKVRRKNILLGALVVVLIAAAAISLVQHQRSQQQERDRISAIKRDKRNFTEFQQEINLLLMQQDNKGVIAKANEYLRVGTSKENIIKMKLTKARAYESVKDYQSALGLYKDAEKDANAIGDTTNYSLHHGLGLLYRKMGDNNKAIKEYEVALKGLKRNPGPNRMEIAQIEEDIRLMKAGAAQ